MAGCRLTLAGQGVYSESVLAFVVMGSFFSDWLLASARPNVALISASTWPNIALIFDCALSSPV